MDLLDPASFGVVLVFGFLPAAVRRAASGKASNYSEACKNIAGAQLLKIVL